MDTPLRVVPLDMFKRDTYEKASLYDATGNKLRLDDAAILRSIVKAVNAHSTLVLALQFVETALFAHAEAGLDTGSRGEQTPVDNNLHPWIPGAEAWPVVEIVRAALKLAEGESASGAAGRGKTVQ